MGSPVHRQSETTDTIVVHAFRGAVLHAGARVDVLEGFQLRHDRAVREGDLASLDSDGQALHQPLLTRCGELVALELPARLLESLHDGIANTSRVNDGFDATGLANDPVRGFFPRPLPA